MKSMSLMALTRLQLIAALTGNIWINADTLRVLRSFGEPYRSQCLALMACHPGLDIDKLRTLEPFEGTYRTQCLSILANNPSLSIEIFCALEPFEDSYRTQCLSVLTNNPSLDIGIFRALEPFEDSYRTQCLLMVANDPSLDIGVLCELNSTVEPYRSLCLALWAKDPMLDVKSLSALHTHGEAAGAQFQAIISAFPTLEVEPRRLAVFAQHRPEITGHADIFFRDILNMTERIKDDDTHLRAALDWLLYSQEITGTPGFSAAYSFRHGWLPPYPETTGYIITTLWNAARELGEDRFAQRAMAAADWEIEIQMDSGAIQAGYYGTDPQGFWKGSKIPAAFNTGQVILGWNRTFEETGNTAYLEASVKACRYLMDCIDEKGVFIKGLSPGPTNPQRSYYTRVAYAIAWTGHLAGERSFEAAARRHLDWVLSRQLQDGWFQGASFLEDETPLTHTMAYTAEGLLFAGELLGDDRYISASERHAIGAMHACERRGFFLPASFTEGWKSNDKFSCLPGNAQFATLWLQHGGRKGDLALVNSGLKMVEWLKRRQSLENPAPGIRGGLPGAWPIDGGYSIYNYVNWATKYFIDALLESQHICRDLLDDK